MASSSSSLPPPQQNLANHHCWSSSSILFGQNLSKSISSNATKTTRKAIFAIFFLLFYMQTYVAASSSNRNSGDCEQHQNYHHHNHRHDDHDHEINTVIHQTSIDDSSTSSKPIKNNNVLPSSVSKTSLPLPQPPPSVQFLLEQHLTTSQSSQSTAEFHSRTNSVFRQALLSTVIVIGSSYLLVYLVNFVRKKTTVTTTNNVNTKIGYKNTNGRNTTVGHFQHNNNNKINYVDYVNLTNDDKHHTKPDVFQSYKIVGKGIDFDNQSLPYNDNQLERISHLLRETRKLAKNQFDNVHTLYDVFERGCQVSENGQCLGRTRGDTIEWITYGEVLKRTKNFADGLLQLGLKSNNQSFLGIYSANCPEYVIAEYASYRHSITVVPIYDTLGANVASIIANQAELSCIVCDKVDRVDCIIEQAKQFVTLKHIVLMNSESVTEQLKDKVTQSGLTLHSIKEVEQLGAQHPQGDHKPGVHDLAIICYTSGTTDVPKGVMLTHENVIASVATISIHLMDQHATTEDVMISILPLAHMFERIGEASVFCEGGKVVYYSGDIQMLAAEIKIIRPTIMLAVPRLLNRIYDAIYNQVRGSIIKRTLLRLAYDSKRKDLHRHVIRSDTIWDWIVFSKIRANLGGRVRLICVGSAPLSHNVLDFLRCALGCVISEGYGQTECVGPCTATVMGDSTTGHVGPPLVGCLVKLTDFAEMGYYAAEGKGEILVKGPVVFKGYYKMVEKTAETLDSEGWLHTGDIGVWTKQGTLRLIDRKKNIFKLSQGEYIAPEKIENILINSRLVAQIFIYGESLKSALVAVVVVDSAVLQFTTPPSSSSLSLAPKLDYTKSSTLNSVAFKELLLDDLQRVGKKAGLKSFELPKNVYITTEPFTIESGLLTPTLKSKRNEIIKRFKTKIDALYHEIEISQSKLK